MVTTVLEFDTLVTDSAGRRWRPQACGDLAPDRLWEGWLEFTPTDGDGGPIRTPRETARRSYDALKSWARTLTQKYLESALSRAHT